MTACLRYLRGQILSCLWTTLGRFVTRGMLLWFEHGRRLSLGLTACGTSELINCGWIMTSGLVEPRLPWWSCCKKLPLMANGLILV
ncbi:MAG: hypothetical protein QG597_2638 [Actinomycetota bacterium]|nr:hypothetical protein [Actinomycetota bacterium]